MGTNYNTITTQNRSMSISSPGGKRIFTKNAPVARNWVSANNQDRAKDINHFRDRQTTKHAIMRYTATGGGYAGTNVTINALNGASHDWQNLFADTGGLTPNAGSKVYQPKRMTTPLFAITGTDPSTMKEWIVWNGSNQLVEIEGDINIGTTNGTARKVSISIHINDLPIPSNADATVYDGSKAGNTDPVLFCQQNSGSITPYMSVKAKTFLNSGYTVKLMIGRVDGTNDQIPMTVMSANLRVRTIPMF